jgi:hypothetical protein
MPKYHFGEYMWRLPRVGKVPLTRESIQSLTQGISDKIRGNYAPPILIEERIRICGDCPFGGKRCAFCGCYINSKASLSNSKCPQNKWPSLDNLRIDAGKHENTKEKANKIE